MENLLKKAKNNDWKAIQEIINKYMPLVLSESSKYDIPGYDFEDIVQHSILSIIKSIKLYKTGLNSFDSFVVTNIKSNNTKLLKSKMKHNREIQNLNNMEISEESYVFTIGDQAIAYNLVESLSNTRNTLKYF
ncbi:sigma factor [Clostridium grantii]|uniref:RNA polymerase sigma factor, sigma-70 family n=1 Tax=Clostridium grantii DSM 8605 TaxID=1121316 RepID=A0A1M5VCC8_9CLOT|nr:sigma factor [Clostridium grantii]SHH72865.1 RNA polymerase sigma factor, sigma-70 family [Clostridium grantii DSM 8605]